MSRKEVFLLSLYFLCTIQISAAKNASHLEHYYKVSAEKVSKEQASSELQKVGKKSRLVSIVKSIVDSEVKRLENSITDSVMEEVISYYGQRLESAEAIKNDVMKLNEEYAQLNKTISKLGSNYQYIEKNHQNLVNTVRNSMDNAKRLREKYLKLKYSARKQIRNKSFLKNRDLDNEVENNETTEADLKFPLQPEALKQQLIKDLETKYSSLIGDSITNEIVKSLKQKDETNAAKIEDNNIDLEDKNKISQKSAPNDCQDLRNDGFTKNGVYKVFTKNSNHSFDAFCEFEDNIGWTVLQRRHNGAVDFNQDWKAYKQGFGNIFEGHEFWLGLEKMHYLTTQFDYSIQVVLNDWKNQKYIAEYGQFRIDSELSKYKLTISGYFSNSTAGDSLGDSMNSFQSHNGMAFSTFDSDNDMRFYDNCAKIFKSGWWFNACFQANLNGAYYRYSETDSSGNSKSRRLREEENSQLRFLRNGIHWNSIDFYKSLKATKLRIRRSQ